MCEASILTPSRAIHAVMEIRVMVWHLLQELCHMFGVPHEASGRVLNGKENSVSYTKAAQFLGAFIQQVGGGNLGSMQRA